MEFKCGALSPPSSISLISVERLTLSFPFQIKSKIILFASFTNSLFNDIKLVRYKQEDRDNKGFDNLNSPYDSQIPPTFANIVHTTFKDICYKFLNCSTPSWEIQVNIDVYKITKIVRALWLAEGRVCMRVCKLGCDVKMFCFSRANHASTNLKKVLSWKPQQVYFIYPFPRRLKLGNL